jgi:hypothetical protein
MFDFISFFYLDNCVCLVKLLTCFNFETIFELYSYDF